MFIDANVFIAAYLDSGEQGKKSKRLLARIAAGEQHAVTSALVINEVFYKIRELRGVLQVERIHRNILSYPHLLIMPIDNQAISASIGYMKEGLGTSDAFHAAVMKIAGVGVICSFDSGFDKVKGIRRQEPK
jgi:predicted nucleic acid-binding protein